MKKKILYVVEAMGGGIFTYLLNLSNELSRYYDISIAYSVRDQTPDNFCSLFNDNVQLIRVNHFCRNLNLKNDILAYMELYKIVLSVKPNIIHLHSSKAGALGRMLPSGTTPLFYTPHGYSFLMTDCNSLKTKLYLIIEKICALRRCTTISCSRGEHLETLKLTSNAFFINNGINIDEIDFVKRKMKQSIEGITVFTVGRICSQKNPKLFNKIAEKLPSIQFVWIGDGELKTCLTSKNIVVTGWLDHKDVLLEMSRYNVFLLTSKWEGLPISLLEAMYLRKKCVVSNVIGNNDVIKKGYNGFVCDSVEEYLEAIVCKDNVDEIVDNAYNDICREYNTKVMAKRYKAIYEKHIYLD